LKAIHNPLSGWLIPWTGLEMIPSINALSYSLIIPRNYNIETWTDEYSCLFLISAYLGLGEYYIMHYSKR